MAQNVGFQFFPKFDSKTKNVSATPNQRASPTPVEISTQHFADSRHTSSSKTSVAVSTRASIQSFETNYETLDQEFANMQQQPFNSLYASTNDILGNFYMHPSHFSDYSVRQKVRFQNIKNFLFKLSENDI